MDQIPQRTIIASLYRKPLNLLETILPTAFLNPNYLQITALLLSVTCLFISHVHIELLLVIIILITDWLDGASARSNKITSKKGWMKDVVVDRISEGFIFAAHLSNPVGKVFFALYIINTILSIYSVTSGKHFILPLRFMWILYLGVFVI